MLSINIDAGGVLGFLGAVEIPFTIANIVDAKVKKPILSTVAKITQLVPIAYFWAWDLHEKVRHAIFWLELPLKSADFLANVAWYTAGAFILAAPITFKLLQIAAKRFHWERFGRILNATEKTLMTIVKIANIGVLVLGLATAISLVYPLGIVACSALLAANVWATVSYIWPHRSNASQVSALKALPNPT